MQRSRPFAFIFFGAGLVLFLFASLLSWKLEESRDTSLELESGRYVSGSVSEDSPTITTHHFKAEAVLYTYTKYEEYKESDDDTQRRVLASFTRCARDFVRVGRVAADAHSWGGAVVPTAELFGAPSTSRDAKGSGLQCSRGSGVFG